MLCSYWLKAKHFSLIKYFIRLKLENTSLAIGFRDFQSNKHCYKTEKIILIIKQITAVFIQSINGMTSGSFGFDNIHLLACGLWPTANKCILSNPQVHCSYRLWAEKNCCYV